MSEPDKKGNEPDRGDNTIENSLEKNEKVNSSFRDHIDCNLVMGIVQFLCVNGILFSIFLCSYFASRRYEKLNLHTLVSFQRTYLTIVYFTIVILYIWLFCTPPGFADEENKDDIKQAREEFNKTSTSYWREIGPHLIEMRNDELQPSRGEWPKIDEVNPHLTCVLCKQIPYRAYHCEKCGGCVLRMSHHSNIIGQCIGAKNIKIYLLFLIAIQLYFLPMGTVSVVGAYYLCRYTSVDLIAPVGLVAASVLICVYMFHYTYSYLKMTFLDLTLKECSLLDSVRLTHDYSAFYSKDFLANIVRLFSKSEGVKFEEKNKGKNKSPPQLMKYKEMKNKSNAKS